jgi:hypothetical protein
VSLERIAAAWKVSTSSGAKLVLVNLCDRANGRGLAWPSVGRIAADCCLSKSTVNRALVELVAGGHLAIRRFTGGANVYTVTPGGAVTLTRGAVTVTGGDVTVTRGGCHGDTQNHQRIPKNLKSVNTAISDSEVTQNLAQLRKILRGKPMKKATA